VGIGYLIVMKYFYYCNCVGWDSKDVNAEGGLCDMVDSSIDITRSTFLKHIDKDSLYRIEKDLGYERFERRGLTMAKDWAVSYHRSKWHGKTVYYFRQSAIEYVFVRDGVS
jgi:hypothetical protein